MTATTEERIAMLTGAATKLESEREAAEESAAKLRSEYERDALNRIASGNAAAALKARNAIADAEAEVSDLRAGLAQTREYLQQARAELQSERDAAAWRAADVKMNHYLAATESLQDAVDVFVAAFIAAEQAAIAAERAVPAAGGERYAHGWLIRDTRLYITRKGGDSLGSIGHKTLDPDYARQLPDLVQKAKSHVAGLLALRHAPTTRDAA